MLLVCLCLSAFSLYSLTLHPPLNHSSYANIALRLFLFLCRQPQLHDICMYLCKNKEVRLATSIIKEYNETRPVPKSKRNSRPFPTTLKEEEESPEINAKSVMEENSAYFFPHPLVVRIIWACLCAFRPYCSPFPFTVVIVNSIPLMHRI